jgi:hypothetical protein
LTAVLKFLHEVAQPAQKSAALRCWRGRCGACGRCGTIAGEQLAEQKRAHRDGDRRGEVSARDSILQGIVKGSHFILRMSQKLTPPTRKV